MSSIASSDDDDSIEEEMPPNPCDCDEPAEQLYKINKLIKIIMNYCMEGVVDVEGLREKTHNFSSEVVHEAISRSHLLHFLLMTDDNVSLEVVKYLVELAPESISTVGIGEDSEDFLEEYYRSEFWSDMVGALPLHIACNKNSDCSDSIIRFLFQKYPSAAKQIWISESGNLHSLPLHLYLMRAVPQEAYIDPNDVDEETGVVFYEHPEIPGRMLDYDLVEMLVKAYPEALITNMQKGYSTYIEFPMNILCQGCDVTLELAKLLTDDQQRCFVGEDSLGYQQTEKFIPPIRYLVMNTHVEHFPIDVLHYLKECSPSSLRGEEKPSENEDNPVGLGEDNDNLFDDWSVEDLCFGIGTDSLLHIACSNPKISAEAIKLIIDECPDMVREEFVYDGFLPIHNLCKNEDLDNGTSMEILKLLVDNYPESVMKNIAPQRLPAWFAVERENDLPIHFACQFKSLEFCRYLVEKYPDCISLRQLHYKDEYELRGTGCSMLPFHLACKYGSLDLVQYLLEQYPAALDEQTSDRDYNVDRRADETISPVNETIASLLQVGDHPLHLAASREHSPEKIEIINFLLRKDASGVSKIGKYGNLPLHRACGCNSGPDIDVITMLVKAYPTALLQKNIFGQFPIHLAMQTSDESNFDGLTFLAKYKPATLGIGIADDRGMSCAHYACSSEHALKKLEVIAEVCPEAFRCQSETCGLPIHYASKKGCDEEVLKFLIAQYPESLVVHHYHDNLGSPLHCAAKDRFKDDLGPPLQHAKFKCMRLLLQERYKALLEMGIPIVHAFLDDQQILDKDQILAEHPFSREEQVEEDAMGRTLLHLIFRHTTDTDVIMRLCIFHSSCLSTQDNNGWLPLHHAMRHKASPETISHMISRGDPEHLQMTDRNGQTPLHVACRWGEPTGTSPSDHFERLQNAIGAVVGKYPHLVRMMDNNGCTVLHLACRHAHSRSIIKVLLAGNTDLILSINNNRQSILHAACEGRAPVRVIRYLSSFQELLPMRDNDERTILHAACDGEASVKVVKYLVDELGFDIAAVDCRGDVPLHRACRVGNVPIIEYLMEKDMTAIFARNTSNELPIHLLCSRSGKRDQVLDSVEYTGAIFRLVLAWPEAVDQASFPVPDIGSISLSDEV